MFFCRKAHGRPCHEGAGRRDCHRLTLVPPSTPARVRWGSRGRIMSISVPEISAEAGSVTVVPTIVRSDEHISAHDVRSTVARVLVALPFALACQMETAAHYVALRIKRSPD
jgi:hypothetical protein